MAMDTYTVFAASYSSQDDALADYNSVNDLYDDNVGPDTYDAAVISKDADGSVKIVKRREIPTRQGAERGLAIGLATGMLAALFPAITLGGALLVGGAAGAGIGAIAGHVQDGMSSSDLKEIGDNLSAGDSGLIVVAATDMQKRVNEAISRTQKMVNKEIQSDSDDLQATVDQAVAAANS